MAIAEQISSLGVEAEQQLIGGLGSVSGAASEKRKAQEKEQQDKEQQDKDLAVVLTSRIFFKKDGAIDHALVRKHGGFIPEQADVFVPKGETERAMAALGSVESGGNVTGRVRYGAIGPLCPRHVTGKYGDLDGHALGGFQVMAENVEPWAREAGLSGVTPQQFLANPELQKKIVAHQIEKHLAHGHSLKDVASIWHSGRTLESARAHGVGDGINSTVHYADMVAGHYAKLRDSSLASSADLPESRNKPHHAALKAKTVVVADAKKPAANGQNSAMPHVG